MVTNQRIDEREDVCIDRKNVDVPEICVLEFFRQYRKRAFTAARLQVRKMVFLISEKTGALAWEGSERWGKDEPSPYGGEDKGQSIPRAGMLCPCRGGEWIGANTQRAHAHIKIGRAHV